jgi:hypothetical protein
MVSSFCLQQSNFPVKDQDHQTPYLDSDSSFGGCLLCGFFHNGSVPVIGTFILGELPLVALFCIISRQCPSQLPAEQKKPALSPNSSTSSWLPQDHYTSEWLESMNLTKLGRLLSELSSMTRSLIILGVIRKYVPQLRPPICRISSFILVIIP